jgi:hypothetical protein
VEIDSADLPQSQSTWLDPFASAGENDTAKVVEARLAVYRIPLPIDTLEELTEGHVAMRKLVPRGRPSVDQRKDQARGVHAADAAQGSCRWLPDDEVSILG